MDCIISQETGINWWLIVLLIIGYPVFKFLITVFYEVFKFFLPIPDLLKRYCRKDAQTWAVVTGATDGIGLGFCQVLTKLGFNIVLVSRNPEKLKVTVQNLQKLRPENCKAQFKTIPFDFKDSSDSAKFKKLMQQLQMLDIGLLVNNVGTSDANLFHNFSYEKIVDIININCVSMAALSAQVLALMKKRSHKSALINLSSYMQEGSLPYFSLYSATKAFNRNLTEGLAYQYPEIDVLCIKPMFVETPLSRQKKGFTIPDRRQCATESLKELTFESQSFGYISHRIIGSAKKNIIPDLLYRWGVKIFTKKLVSKVFPKLKLD